MKISIHDKTSLSEFVQRLAPQTNMSASRLKTAIAKSYHFKHITALEAALSSADSKPSPEQATPGSSSAPANAVSLSEQEQGVFLELSYWLDDCTLLEEGLTFGNFEFSEQKATPAHVLSSVLKLVYPEQFEEWTITPDDREILSVFSSWCRDHAEDQNVINSLSSSGSNKITPSLVHSLITDLLNRTEEYDELDYLFDPLKLTEKERADFGYIPPNEIEVDCLKHFGVERVEDFDFCLYDRAVEQLVSSVAGLKGVEAWTNAMVALERAGFGDIAKHLRQIQIASLRVSFIYRMDL